MFFNNQDQITQTNSETKNKEDTETQIETDFSTILVNTEINIPETNLTVQIKQNDQSVLSAEFQDEGTNGAIILDVEKLTLIAGPLFLMPFSINTDGSGVFEYVGLFGLKDQALIHIDSKFLGDRIRITGINSKLLNPDIDSYQTTISYLTHTPEQSLSEEPTQATSFTLNITPPPSE